MTNREPDSDFEDLLTHLRETRGFDFTAYKRSTLGRRVQKRIAAAGVDSFGEYKDYLEVHPDEFAALFNTILINVTSFFRDPQAWEQLARDVIPQILEDREPGAPVRVWSAGCASGEEAYTLATVLCEAMGEGDFRQHAKIYATDAAEEELVTARQGSYTAKQLQPVPQELRRRYFEANGERFGFRKDLRRALIFGRHDLIQDAPISRLDLLVSRNTLMYFNADAQSRVLARFYYALNEGGYLFLGKAETLLSRAQVFTPVDLKTRIFVKPPRSPDMRERLMLEDGASPEENLLAVERDHIREIAFESDPFAQIVLDANLRLTVINERARDLFSLGTRDIGRPIQDLDVSYRPVELRTSINLALNDRKSVVIPEVLFPPDGAPGNRWFDIHVVPLLDQAQRIYGAKLVFMNVTRTRELAEELQQSRGDLETAYEELQSTNEELETTNEELQSTVEELETTNEELQSTNEELETMNEELQSTNEELEAVNDELRERGDEVNVTNAFLEAMLTSLRFGLVVIDGGLIVTGWNRQAEELWGIRADEARGKNLLRLDIGFNFESVIQPLREIVAGKASDFETIVEATNRRGRTIRCRVSISPMPSIPNASAIIQMEDLEHGEDDR